MSVDPNFYVGAGPEGSRAIIERSPREKAIANRILTLERELTEARAELATVNAVRQ